MDGVMPTFLFISKYFGQKSGKFSTNSRGRDSNNSPSQPPHQIPSNVESPLTDFQGYFFLPGWVCAVGGLVGCYFACPSPTHPPSLCIWHMPFSSVIIFLTIYSVSRQILIYLMSSEIARVQTADNVWAKCDLHRHVSVNCLHKGIEKDFGV